MHDRSRVTRPRPRCWSRWGDPFPKWRVTPAASDATFGTHSRSFAGGVGVFGSVAVRISLGVGVLAVLVGGAPSALAVGFPSAGRTVVGATTPPRYVIVSSDLTAPPSEFNSMGTASCPAGTATWGGGMYFASYQVPTSSINSSFWNDSSPGGWVARVSTTPAQTAMSLSFQQSVRRSRRSISSSRQRSTTRLENRPLGSRPVRQRR